MEFVSSSARRTGGLSIAKSASVLAVASLGLGAIGGVQAATLTCGTPVHVSTADKTQWRTDARKVSDDSTAAIVDDYLWGGWFNPATIPTPIPAKWLSFGTTGAGYPLVTIQGDRSKGAWVKNRGTFIYNEAITVDPNVDLSSIKVKGRGGADNAVNFAVMPAKLPGGVDNTTANNPNWPWVSESPLGLGYGAPGNINLDGSTQGLGFYYGENQIGLAIFSEYKNDAFPGGVVADFEITADCQTPVAAQPTKPLMCPAGSKEGDPIEIGPFITNARDWKWTWRTNAAGKALENVEQPLFDDYMYRDYFRPSALPAVQKTDARWISPGTTSPAGRDVPGVPYPPATGQSKPGWYASVFTMNQPITVGNNVDPASIRLKGRFAFDDTGDSVFVQPAGDPAPTSFPSNLLPDGFGGFTTWTTPAIPGFKQGLNTIGLVLDGGQKTNDCGSGVCALAAIAEFTVTAQCTGAAPLEADMQASAPTTLSATVGTPVSLTSTCTNAGPDAAANATCTVTGAPAGATTTCTPATSVASLAKGGTISCTTKFTPQTAAPITLTTTAGSGSGDPDTANNTASTTVGVGLQPAPVPTLGPWALGLLAGLLGLMGFRRRGGAQ